VQGVGDTDVCLAGYRRFSARHCGSTGLKGFGRMHVKTQSATVLKAELRTRSIQADFDYENPQTVVFRHALTEKNAATQALRSSKKVRAANVAGAPIPPSLNDCWA